MKQGASDLWVHCK